MTIERWASVAGGTLSLIVVGVWLPAAVAAWRAGLPRRVTAGAALGVSLGACGVALAVPRVWDDWRAPVLIGATMNLAATAGPALALWGLAAAWRRLETVPADDPTD